MRHNLDHDIVPCIANEIVFSFYNINKLTFTCGLVDVGSTNKIPPTVHGSNLMSTDLLVIYNLNVQFYTNI